MNIDNLVLAIQILEQSEKDPNLVYNHSFYGTIGSYADVTITPAGLLARDYRTTLIPRWFDTDDSNPSYLQILYTNEDGTESESMQAIADWLDIPYFDAHNIFLNTALYYKTDILQKDIKIWHIITVLRYYSKFRETPGFISLSA